MNRVIVGLTSVMENDACVEQKIGDGGDAAVDQVEQQPAAATATAPYRYSKEELLEIKELPVSNERPDCLSEKYDSDGIWDPEKWHASLYPTSGRSSPVEGFKKDYVDDRVPLKRRIPDPRERLKEDDLDVVLSPQRRSFGGGCQGNAALAPHARRPISPLENKENESLRLGGARRIGSGRIIAARAFEREPRMDKERERERDFKDKRFRRDYGDKRVFSERRRNDSYAEEEPEWFSQGPTSQSETIELIGFDDKILEDAGRRSKRSRKRAESIREAPECNGVQTEERDAGLQSTADQEVPHSDVLPEQSAGDFDFNEFFNLEKTMPGLASHPSDPAVVSLSEAQVPPQQQKNIFQELLGRPARSASPTLLVNLLGSSDGPTTHAPLHGLLHKGPSPPLFPQRAPSPDYFNTRLQHSAGYPVCHQPMMPEQFVDVHRSISPGSAIQQQMRALSMPVNQADLEALAFQQDLALHAHHAYQSGYKPPLDKSYRNRLQRVNRSPGPGPPPAGRNSPGNAVTMLSPSFTPTSVIRKMYATKEKSRDEPSSRSETKEEAAGHSLDDGSSQHLYLEAIEGNAGQSGGVKIGSQTFPSKDQERLRPGSAGHSAPTMAPGPSSSFPRPIYPVPLLSHVPMVRPPPQLHPNVVQRMLAQGIQPQQLGPALAQAGIFPQHVDLAQLQGLPPALLGQQLYPLSATGHPLLPPRVNTQMQLAVMQQQLQQQRPMHPGIPGPPSHSHGPHRTNGSQQQGLGLAKWFGSDVLEQPLPSMPAKVISVDELEFRP
ncbi:eukaryotic translation initiation factor 4E transporter isoform X5 [Sebastes fasciatus]|uniref:eukaryotic translation initiation factor 4E transporter isoform X5 n=1 Tax=Sebastes fasciatus TaxID=394691 RepID=UPI003D9F8746